MKVKGGRASRVKVDFMYVCHDCKVKGCGNFMADF